MNKIVNITIKELPADDSMIPKCAELIKKHSWGEHYPLPALEELEKAEYIVAAFDGDRVVGCMSLNRHASPDGKDIGKLWLAGAVVHPEYRGQKIFTRLYQRCLKYAQSKKEVMLSCTNCGYIERFITKRGWRYKRDIKDDNNESCRVYNYEKTLSR